MMATEAQVAALVAAAGEAESVLREMHQEDVVAVLFEALRPFESPGHSCPENPHVGCTECGGNPVCECAPGQCPED